MSSNRRSRHSHVVATGALALALAAAAGGGCSSGGDTDGGLMGGLLEGLTPPTPGEAARQAFNTYDADERRNALALLASSSFGGEPPYLRTYRLLIDDPDATVRAAAIKALGMHGTVEDAPMLAQRLKDDAPFVRWEAAKALQRVHNPAVAQSLMDALRSDQDADVRMAAAEALGQYARPAVYDTLVGALTDTNYGVVNAANRSLRTLTGYDGDADPVVWLAWGRLRRGELFANQRRYEYRDYQKPPGLIQKMLPWADKDAAPRKRSPVGLQESGDTPANG